MSGRTSGRPQRRPSGTILAVLALTAIVATPAGATGSPFVLAVDVIDDSGIDFVQAPNRLGPPDPFGDPPRYQTFQETTTGGACWGDHDGDGLLDIFVTDTYGPGGEGHGRLYRNLGRGADGVVRFADVTEAQGLVVKGVGQGCVWGDYDNDGRQDLFLTFSVTDYALQKNMLFHNRGDGQGFEDVTHLAGVSGNTDDPEDNWRCNAELRTDDGFVPKCWSMSAAWIDHDLDGDLDLYVGNYVDESGAACVENPFPNPILCNGQPNRLYRNDGGHRFTEVGGEMTVQSNGEATLGRSLGVIATDLNEDTWPDIYVANDYDANALYLKNRIGNFRSVGIALQVDGYGEKVRQGDGPRAGMGIDANDLNNDGLIDLVTTHLHAQYDAVYLGTAPGRWAEVGNLSETMGRIAMSGTRWGGGFVDLDRDGWKDYLVVAGHQYAGRSGSISLALNRMAEAGVPRTTDAIVNATEDPWRLAEAPYWVFGRDVNATAHNHRGAAFADYDDDGDMDVFVTALESYDAGRGRPKLLRFDATGSEPTVDHPDNPVRASRWLRVTLEGTDNARDAFGTKVQVTTPSGPPQWQWKASGGSYGGNNDPRLLFALGEADTGTVTVTWPGKPDAPQVVPFALGEATGKTIHIVEPESAAPAPPLWLHDPVTGPGRLRLSWSMNQATDLDHYKVYVGKDARAADRTFKVAQHGPEGSLVKGLSGGLAFVWVTAVDAAGRESPPSAKLSVDIDDPGLFSAVPAPALGAGLSLLLVLLIWRRRTP